MKTCSRCKVDKSESEFNKNRLAKSGLHSLCRVCHRESARAWAKNNTDRCRENMRAWRASNKDKVNADNRDRYWKNVGQERARKKKYVGKNKERVYEYNGQWAKDHPSSTAAQRAKRRARVLGRGNFSAQEWSLLQEEYGHRCAYCNEESKKLEPDHVVPLAIGGSNEADNIVPACRTCNRSKGAKPMLLWMFQNRTAGAY